MMIFRDWCIWYIENFMKMPQLWAYRGEYSFKHPSCS